MTLILIVVVLLHVGRGHVAGRAETGAIHGPSRTCEGEAAWT